MPDENPCCCTTRETCMQFSATAGRYNDQSAHAAAMSINNQNNLQMAFNVQAQQGLESSPNSRLGAELAGFAAAAYMPRYPAPNYPAVNPPA